MEEKEKTNQVQRTKNLVTTPKEILNSMEKGNIFSEIPESLPKELLETLTSSKNCKIERIISKGHSTPDGKWYDQDKNEFVILLKGYAELLFENNELIKMNVGDYINIPAHTKHRVEKTSKDQETIWLAMFY